MVFKFLCFLKISSDFNKTHLEAKFQYYTKEKIRQQVSKYTLAIPEADKEDVVQKVRDILLKNTCSDGSSRNAQAVCESIIDWMRKKYPKYNWKGNIMQVIWTCVIGELDGYFLPTSMLLIKLEGKKGF